MTCRLTKELLPLQFDSLSRDRQPGFLTLTKDFRVSQFQIENLRGNKVTWGLGVEIGMRFGWTLARTGVWRTLSTAKLGRKSWRRGLYLQRSEEKV